jgi:hypothetical protein
MFIHGNDLETHHENATSPNTAVRGKPEELRADIATRLSGSFISAGVPTATFGRSGHGTRMTSLACRFEREKTQQIKRFRVVGKTHRSDRVGIILVAFPENPVLSPRVLPRPLVSRRGIPDEIRRSEIR